MKQRYEIQIESGTGGYDEVKKFRISVEMTETEFLALCGLVVNTFPERKEI